MKKDLKEYLKILAIAIIIPLVASYGFYMTKTQGQRQASQQTSSLFGNTTRSNSSQQNQQVEQNNEDEDLDPREIWENSVQDTVFFQSDVNYTLLDRPFYKKWYDKLRGKKIYEYEGIDNKNLHLTVEVEKEKITGTYSDNNNITKTVELIPTEDYSSYSYEEKDMVNNSTLMVGDVMIPGQGVEEFSDGRRIEFTDVFFGANGALKEGPAVEYLTDNSKIEFNYIQNIRYGEAEKTYQNGDKELFSYDQNGEKSGLSIYFFSNGDREESTYENGILNGPARYVYADGDVDYYRYTNGKRVETSVREPMPKPEETSIKAESTAKTSNIDSSQDYDLATLDEVYRQVIVNGNEGYLRNFTREELGIIRNTIYAKRGYIFKTDKYKRYFAKKPWYNGRYQSQNIISRDEEKLANIIKKYE